MGNVSISDGWLTVGIALLLVVSGAAAHTVGARPVETPASSSAASTVGPAMDAPQAAHPRPPDPPENETAEDRRRSRVRTILQWVRRLVAGDRWGPPDRHGGFPPWLDPDRDRDPPPTTATPTTTAAPPTTATPTSTTTAAPPPTTTPTATPPPTTTATPTTTTTTTTPTATTTTATPTPTTTTTTPTTTTTTPTTTTTTTPTLTTTTTPTPTPTPTTTTTTTPTPTTTTTTTTTPTTTTAPPSETPDPDDPGVSTYRVSETVTVRSDTVESLIHEKVNDVRAERGLPRLDYSEKLASVSRAHSEDMATRDYFSHTNPEGEQPWDRYGDHVDSPVCRAYGENIAYNWVDSIVRSDGGGLDSSSANDAVAGALVDQWMSSTGHRRNILSENWDAEGLGVYVTDEGQVYATQNFCG